MMRKIPGRRPQFSPIDSVTMTSARSGNFRSFYLFSIANAPSGRQTSL